ncbi:MAG TPA: phosphate ABC transporter substrate-binding protein PstS [Candidatus Udaeobacter sp.]|nr:phosphate ABC transporter substrate-binding protein PstS [Candidatus Udaeobacter sp.]
METTHRLWQRKLSAIPSLALVLMVALSGCGGQQKPQGGTSAAGGTLVLTGAGSTFAYPLYSKWFDEYRKVAPNLQCNYQAIGSGAGIEQMIAGTIDFGGTDSPMTDAQMAEFKTKRGAGVLHFPVALGAVVPTTNLPGVNAELTFKPEILAGIYLGTITKWNDPALTAANPGVKLPATDIVVVHRSDGSGTTFVWSDYLSKVSPAWKSKIGSANSLSWPAGIGAKGNDGVAGTVRQTPNSIGYVELIYAIQNNLSYGKVVNQGKEAIRADLASVTAAAAGTASSMPADFRVSITNAPGKGAYPISTYTWMLLPDTFADSAKKQALVGFLGWALTSGQEMLAPLSYARLAPEVIAKEQAALQQIH